MVAAGTSVAPDVAGTVVGWRCWDVAWSGGQPLLISPQARTRWAPGSGTAAVCHAAHAVPADDCSCGLYAVSDLPTAFTVAERAHVWVVGCVALWGDVLEGERGWRASYGYPRLLLVDHSIDGATARGLALAYGVPVYRMRVLSERQTTAMVDLPAWPRRLYWRLVIAERLAFRIARLLAFVVDLAARWRRPRRVDAKAAVHLSWDALIRGRGYRTLRALRRARDRLATAGDRVLGRVAMAGLPDRRRPRDSCGKPVADKVLMRAVREVLDSSQARDARCRRIYLRRPALGWLIVAICLYVVPELWLKALFQSLLLYPAAHGWIRALVGLLVLGLAAGVVVVPVVMSLALPVTVQIVRAIYPTRGRALLAVIVVTLAVAGIAQTELAFLFFWAGARTIVELTLPPLAPAALAFLIGAAWLATWRPARHRKPVTTSRMLPPGVLYDDGCLVLDEAGITIRRYYACGARPKRIPLSAVQQALADPWTPPLHRRSGKPRRCGIATHRGSRLWLPLDRHRAFKRGLIVFDLGRRIKPCVSPLDTDEVIRLLRGRVPVDDR